MIVQPTRVSSPRDPTEVAARKPRSKEPAPSNTANDQPSVINRLRMLAKARGLTHLEHDLDQMAELVDGDLRDFRRQLGDVSRGEALIEHSARHLLNLDGKYIRPLCLLLAAKSAPTEMERVVPVAVAVELIHSATLLHDDVVDLGNSRRGTVTSRAIYGNAASIFAGDFLLIDALRRIRASGWSELLDTILETIDEMIRAESIQLENRGKLVGSVETYFSIVEGKTASLFGWATRAGGVVCGLSPAACDALESFGRNIGIAFQLLDDMLDFTGTASGKDLLADLHEGKSTYPLIYAARLEPALKEKVAELLASDAAIGTEDIEAIRAALKRTNALEETSALAEHHTELALTALESDELASGPSTVALKALAKAALHRDL